MRTRFVSFAALLSVAALAGPTTVERCREAPSKDEQIACLEAALLADSTETQIDPPSLTLDAGPTDTSAVDDAPDVTGIGAEQVVARQQSREQRSAALARSENLDVESYQALAHGRLQVTLRNGQVWRQIKGDTQTVRPTLAKNRTVTIEESSFGGYKLRLVEMRRVIRVQRIR